MSRWNWDHNAFYHRTLLRQLPQHCERILEVGCGAGTLAAELARRADRVDAVDRSAEMIEAARRVVPENVACAQADILEHPLPEAAYDAVVSLTTLHHMPLEQVLPRLAHTLRPGGVLAVIALPRADPLRELPAEVTAALAQRVFGLAFATLRATGRGAWYAHEPTHVAMPVVLDPPLTTREVARRARDILPGARVRRLVFWRYLLRWDKPAQPR
ncbi:class I SAM-dependent methyltransferase [Nocardia sp. MDA0666]|uniref:class I SAM-dependent methyltransferase n=1 Tax=Nocardia sp. MDA0666 TaxID=2135448 RepID=UPI000D12DD0E|nr:class I SAM-dependent methyltransferase [Nocardia sp. MDA0666]PSR66638.1 class I SAM-dependent methyltransferase [Nocardia sp. MDA0666]